MSTCMQLFYGSLSFIIMVFKTKKDMSLASYKRKFDNLLPKE